MNEELRKEMKDALLDGFPDFIKEDLDNPEFMKKLESQMRDVTEEERKAVHDYIESISTPTGVNFYDLIDDCLKSPRDPNIDLPKVYDYNKSYK